VIALRTTSAEATRAVGAALAGVLRPGDVVLLVGDLGAGKTTFAQGVASGLGIGEQVTSPTFTLLRPYACATPGSAANPGKVRTLLHADLYRLDRTLEVAELGLGELVEDEAAALVEWGDMAGPVRLGAVAATVRLAAEDADPDARAVTVETAAGRRDDEARLRDALAAQRGTAVLR
jgi:tRNA threonylcarbamoyladenosine biosynthesis protein TsaE